MGRPRKNPIETGPTPATTTPPEPVRSQVKEMFGGGSADEFRQSLPESTAAGTPTETPKRTYKKRATVETPADPDMQDPLFREAIAGMTSLGGARAVKTGFKAAAFVTSKPDMELNQDETKLWDQYFYVVGKKSQFDPTRPWYLVLYGLLLLGEHIMVRIWKLNADSFANSLGKWFGMGPEAKDEKETEGEAAEND